MTTPLGVHLVGLDAPGTPRRSARAWLQESLSSLALLATRDTYAQQPSLWELGEHGRARTIEDFEHHLRAAMGTDAGWDAHLAYCLELFEARGYPHHWLTDAFATLSRVLVENLPSDVTADVRAHLDGGTARMADMAADRGIDLTRPTRYDRP